MGAHPAQRFSVLHHEDLASAVQLALDGVMDGRTVNIASDAAVSVHEMAHIAEVRYEPSSEPLVNPWHGQVDASLAAQLGIRPRVLTLAQAVREHRL